jgi:hypothetical protein
MATAGLAFDYAHSRAICDEIGGRLRDVLNREASEIPSFLAQLIAQLAELERVPAPSIVPSTDAINDGIDLDHNRFRLLTPKR